MEMKRIAFLAFALVIVASGVYVASAADSDGAARPSVMPASQLFDPLGQDPDVIYLLPTRRSCSGPTRTAAARRSPSSDR